MMGVGVGGMLTQGMGSLFQQSVPAGGGVAGAAAVPPPIPGTFYVAINGQQAGPFDLGALQQQVASGSLARDALVWRPGMAAWGKAGDQAELAPLFASQPPPLPPH